MAIDALIKTVLSELKVAINSKTVIGEPTTFKNWTVIPVTRVSFGFGVGGGNGKNDSAACGTTARSGRLYRHQRKRSQTDFAERKRDDLGKDSQTRSRRKDIQQIDGNR